MAKRQTQIQIPERVEDEAPATSEQLQFIRQLVSGMSLHGFRFDYRKLGKWQASAVIDQLLELKNDQPTQAPPRKQGPGCIASLAKGTTALIVWAIVLAGVAGGAYLIYWQVNRTPDPTETAQNDDNDPQDTLGNPANGPDNPGSSTGSTIFEGLGASDSPNTPTPTPNTTDRSTNTPDPAPTPVTPPTPTIDRDMINQLAGLEEMLVKLSQFTRNEFAADIRDQSSQAMIKKLADYPKALSALDQTDPTLSLRIQAVIDAFAAPTLDGPALREDIKSIRQAIDKLQ